MKLRPMLVILAASLLAVGCTHAQVPPTSPKVNLTLTAPIASGVWGGCTTAAPCTYQFSRVTLTAGATSCPSTTGTSYATIGTAGISTTYSDATASGLTVCYIAQTEQTSLVSQPSNTAGPFVVPGNPLAPSLTATQAMLESNPGPTLAASPDRDAPAAGSLVASIH